MEVFIEANGFWLELFKFIVVVMETADLPKFVPRP